MVFSDPAVEAFVRLRLGDGPIDPELAATLRVAQVIDPVTLADLRCFPSLKTVSIDSAPDTPGKPVDVSGLTGLSQLTDLYFFSVPIEDPTPLASLTAVRFLILWDVGPIDPAFIGSLTTLEQLVMSQLPVEDLSWIVSLKQLTRFSAIQCGITDIAPLAAAELLSSLDLSENLVSDVSPIAALPALDWLDLHKNAITDLGALAASTTSFWEIDLRQNPIDCELQHDNLVILAGKGALTDCAL